MTKSRIFLFLGSICTIFCLTLSACNRHPKAEALYLRAEEAFGTGEYHTAQRIIDSIPESDTLAFEWIRKGIILNQRITLEQNRRNLSFIDSLLPSCIPQEKNSSPNSAIYKTAIIKMKVVMCTDMTEMQGKPTTPAYGYK